MDSWRPVERPIIPTPDPEEACRLTPEERDELIQAVCRAAAQGEQDRINSGLPPPIPAPLPESTIEFLKEAARRVRESAPAR